MWKSILAVFAGIVALTATSFAFELALEPLLQRTLDKTDLSQDPRVKALMYSYCFLCIAWGGWVAARLAPRLAFRHSVAMGFAQVGMTALAAASLPGKASPGEWILSGLLALPAAMLGGWYYTRKMSPA